MANPTSSKDPMMGTWKLNLAKSTYSPGPAPKNAINKFEPWEDGMKATVDLVDGQGNKMHAETTAKFDGNDYPLKGSPMADAVSLKRVSDREMNIVWKKGGQVAMTGKSVISADGQTATVTQLGKDPQGRAINNVAIYDKQ
jgi:hypothetical protein